ncbi:hypothetical protein GCM10010402_78840 [Actinomadura luteofluorescens]
MSSLSLPDRALDDRVHEPQTPSQQRAGEPVEPLVDVVGSQISELGLAEQRDMLSGQAPVVADRVVIQPFEAFGEPVFDAVPERGWMTAQQGPQQVITFADWRGAEHVVLEHLLFVLETSQSGEPHRWSFVRKYPTWRLRHHPTTDHGLPS